ncbi:TetR/AcrR family transcriptional regulator C-terminal ligand-binding domain-containing protein [Actinoplanes sp. NPDC049596]|uniref:TetR/AcrR family transcriptional regulator C-terminal ligand-binding domain-containing protein n=1 Tax=unclassified Actinoplanes TaxID=2626549 RepID=UPI003439E95D
MAAADAQAQLAAVLGTLTLYGDASVVAGAMSSRGEAGLADLRDILHPWLECLVTILDRGVATGKLPRDFPVHLTAQSWLGYIVHRVVFLQEVVEPGDPQTLIRRSLAA